MLRRLFPMSGPAEIERISARLLVQRRNLVVGSLAAQHRGRLVARQRTELDAGELAVSQARCKPLINRGGPWLGRAPRTISTAPPADDARG
jgi:hypothetical protein